MHGIVVDHLSITNDTKYLAMARDFISRLIQGRISESDENKIVLAVDEAITNIIEHGYDKDQVGTIDIQVELTEKYFKIMIIDQGRFFNPDSVPSANIEQHLKMGKKRGLGIFIMRQIMDEVKYKFKEGSKNELTLVKYFK